MIAGITNYGANGPEIRWHICWSVERIILVAARVLKTVKAGNSVVVVSAMGKPLIKLATKFLQSQSPGDGYATLNRGASLNRPVEYGIARIGNQQFPHWRTSELSPRQNTPALGFCISNPNGFHGTSRIIKWLW